MRPIKIVDIGRGPEVEGTRIGVLDVLPMVRRGWQPASIALFFGLSTREVQALLDYFEEHREEILADEREIEERAARGNPPEVQAMYPASSLMERMQARLDELRRHKKEEADHARNSR